MRVAMRGALAVALLAGVYLLGFAIVAGAVACAVLVAHDPTAGALKLFVLVALAAGATVRGLWAGLRAQPSTDAGLLVSRTEQPKLWAAVDDLATQVGTRGPDQLRLIPAVNAAVVEESRWLGLRPGQRTMYVGLPLVQGMTVAELRSVLAHELGHYSGRHTATGPIVYRGHSALENVVAHLRHRRFVQRIFVGYAKLFFRVSRTVSRRQEFEADASAADIAGRDATVSALSRLPALSAAWRFYLRSYVAPPIDRSVVPATLLSGFSSLLEHPERRQEMAAVGVDERPPSVYDTHPAITERVAALARHAAGPAADDRPAVVLLDGEDQLEALMPSLLLNVTPTAVDWDSAATSVGRDEARTAGQALLRASGTATSPADVLELLRAGRGPALAGALSPQQAQAAQTRTLSWAIVQLVLSVLAQAGRCRWTVSWAGAPWQPVTDIDIVELRGLLDAAIADPQAVDRVVDFLHRHDVDLAVRLAAAPPT